MTHSVESFVEYCRDEQAKWEKAYDRENVARVEAYKTRDYETAKLAESHMDECRMEIFRLGTVIDRELADAGVATLGYLLRG